MMSLTLDFIITRSLIEITITLGSSPLVNIQANLLSFPGSTQFRNSDIARYILAAWVLPTSQMDIMAKGILRAPATPAIDYDQLATSKNVQLAIPLGVHERSRLSAERRSLRIQSGSNGHQLKDMQLAMRSV